MLQLNDCFQALVFWGFFSAVAISLGRKSNLRVTLELDLNHGLTTY